MRNRLWPAFCCAAALLLAATPLLATDDPKSETTASGTPTDRYVGPTLRPPSPMPAIPAGDDDTPDRTTPRRGSNDNDTTASGSVATAAGEGWRTPGTWTGWRQYWFRIINFWFLR